jgi:phosphoglycolate phosphatase
MPLKQRNIAAVLFDLDGTLVDSAPDLAAAADQMRLARALPSLPLQAYRAHCGSGARGMLKVAFGIEPEHTDFEPLREEFFVNYTQCLTARTRLFEGVVPLVQQLAACGLAWGVVTNKSERFALPLLATMPVFTSAATVVCGDTTPHTKPHPAPLLEAARRIGVAPAHCVYVGDDLRDILAGKAAGMATVAAHYGYLGPQAQVDQWGADLGIESPLGLVEHLPSA